MPAKKLDYRVVHPANPTLVLKEESWPADSLLGPHRFPRQRRGQARPDATPRFILAQDGKVVLTVTGNAGWKDKMWPKMLEVTGTKA